MKNTADDEGAYHQAGIAIEISHEEGCEEEGRSGDAEKDYSEHDTICGVIRTDIGGHTRLTKSEHEQQEVVYWNYCCKLFS